MLLETRIPTLVAALAMGGLAAWLVYLRPRDRVHRALALFLVFRALFYGLRSFSPTIYSLPGRLGRYAQIAIPFAAANFAIVFWSRYGPGGYDPPSLAERASRWGILLAALAFEAVYFLDNDLMLGPQSEAPLTLFQPLTYVAYAVIALIVFLGVNRAKEHHRTGLFFLSVGFALEPAFWGTFLSLQTGVAPPSDSIVLWAQILLLLTAALGVGLLVLLAAGRAWRSGAEADQSRAFRLTGLLAFPVACAVVANELWFTPITPTDKVVVFGFDAFWHLALVLFATYALVRHQLFGIDLKMKGAIEKTTVGGVFAGAFFVASELLETVVPVEGNLLGLGAALLIAASLHPVRRFAEGVAHRVLPTVEDTPEYRRRRATELYRSSVEEVCVDGKITDEERKFLEGLRSSLELPDEEADRIEQQVRGLASES